MWLLEYVYSLPSHIMMTPITQSHRMLSSIAFFISPTFRLLNVTCRFLLAEMRSILIFLRPIAKKAQHRGRERQRKGKGAARREKRGECDARETADGRIRAPLSPQPGTAAAAAGSSIGRTEGQQRPHTLQGRWCCGKGV